MAQGYGYSLLYNDTEFSFKSITYDERPTTINTAQRKAADGSVNKGFNENQGDLRQLVITCEELLDSDDTSGNMVDLDSFDAGDSFPSDTLRLMYFGIEIYALTGVYIADISGRGSIPGEASFRITFESISTGYTKFGQDLPEASGTP